MAVVTTYTLPATATAPPSVVVEVDGEIVHIADHCADGLSQLILEYKDSPVLKELICSFLRQVQILEDTTRDLLASLRDIDTAEGAQLDLIGRIVLETRDGRTDVDYRRGLKVRIRINRSDGKVEDLILISVLYTGSTAVGDIGIVQHQPQSLTVTLRQVFDDPAGLFKRLIEAKAGGVSLSLVYATSVTGFTASDGVITTSATLGYGDSVSGGTGGFLAGVVG